MSNTLIFSSIFKHYAKYTPTKSAFIFDGENQLRTFTWRELNEQINKLSNGFLKLGISHGTKIATILDNSVELFLTYWAAAKIGCVFVPVSTLLRPQGLQVLLQNSQSRVIITSSKHMSNIVQIYHSLNPLIIICTDNHVEEVSRDRKIWMPFSEVTHNASREEPVGVTVNEDDLINIMYSSGTTGLPKGIVHTQRIRSLYGLLYSSLYNITSESVALHAGGIVFNGAFVDMLPTLIKGGTFILQENFTVKNWLRAVKQWNVTHTVLVPSQIIALLSSEEFSEKYVPSLQMVMTLGAPLLKEHKDLLNIRLPGRFWELYGTTEGFVTVLTNKMYEKKPNSVGIPPEFASVEILDDNGRKLGPGQVGEICGYSPVVMKGYYNDEDATKKTFRGHLLATGDLGYLDEDGFLYLVDRKKDMIISGGVNVYPRDIEEILASHPAVLDVAVFGGSDDRWGEVPVAAVVLKNGHNISQDELKHWINHRVAAKFQRVHHIEFISEMPRNVAGKTLKRELKENWEKKSIKVSAKL